MSDYLPMSMKAPVANGSANPDNIDLIDGYLLSVQPVVFNTISGQFAIRAPGRYYLTCSRIPARFSTGQPPSISEGLWSGYIDGGAEASIINAACYKGEQISTTIFCDSTPVAGDLIQLWARISTEKPHGGASIHFQAPFTGEGDKLSINLGDPALGADYANQTVPAQVKWRPRGFAGQFVTSAVAANRYLVIAYRDPAGLDYAVHASGALQVASSTHNWTGVVCVGPNYTNDTPLPAAGVRRPVIPLSDEKLRTGSQIRFVTNGIDVNDNWGGGTLDVEEWAGPSA